MLNATKHLFLFLALVFSFQPKEEMTLISHDTWSYFDKITYQNGLPDDRITENQGFILPDRTSPTNIGLYLFSVTCAKNLNIIKQNEAEIRVKQTLKTLSVMKKNHGFYLNWYKASDATHMIEWVPGRPIPSFLSSVDNAWLAASLIHIEKEYPESANDVKKILDEMDFRFFFDKDQGMFFGGFDDDKKAYTSFHYGILNSETRLISYVAIRLGQVDKDHLNKLIKNKKDNIIQSSYGSMFEALAVSLIIPEIEESESWKKQHALYIKTQINFKIEDFWGLSYSDDARGFYKEFGIEKLAQYPAHFENEGVVTPYASFLALQVSKEDALNNIKKLKTVCYGKYGFYGAYRPKTKEVSRSILTIEQSMIMMSIADFEGKNPAKNCFKGLGRIALQH